MDSDGADSGSSSDVMIIAVESQPSEQEFSGYVANYNAIMTLPS